MKQFFGITPSLIAFLATIACQSVYSKSISIMSYNVENLFDTTHDPGKLDWTYLPLAFKKKSAEVKKYCKSISNPYYRRDCYNLDWSEAVLNKKILNLAKVVKSYNQGKGPDILVVQEVENLNALTKFRDVGLKGLGYKEVVLVEGPDKRGIDVGILSKFPLAGPAKINLVDLSGIDRSLGRFSKLTRGILQAKFKVGSKSITVFGNHWSSQGNIDETRLEAAKTLYKVTSKIRNSAVVATGDFNTLDNDSPHGINEIILDESRVYSFYDAEKFEDSANWPGSHWYRGNWNSLDRIFIMKRGADEGLCNIDHCLAVKWDSFEFVKPDFVLHDITYTDRRTGQTRTYKNVPWRFDPVKGEGYSDHLPVAIKVEL